ncbi:hypothetical protein OPFAMLBM_00066 [Aeromonas phage avDM12-TAAL]|nr:hypothetical protein OPFAMLBM_00066 [Aeromonas phage avDM12-TAAL]
MVALPFMMSTANAEFRANGWGSNMRTQAGLPAAGMISELVDKRYLNLIEAPRLFNFIPVNFWFDGTNTIIKHGGPYGSTAQYAIISGDPWIYITTSGAIALDGIAANTWQRMSLAGVTIRKAWSSGGSATVTFGNAPFSPQKRYDWTFTG